MTSLAIENVNGLPLLVVKGERSEVYTMNPYGTPHVMPLLVNYGRADGPFTLTRDPAAYNNRYRDILKAIEENWRGKLGDA